MVAAAYCLSSRKGVHPAKRVSSSAWSLLCSLCGGCAHFAVAAMVLHLCAEAKQQQQRKWWGAQACDRWARDRVRGHGQCNGGVCCGTENNEGRVRPARLCPAEPWLLPTHGRHEDEWVQQPHFPKGDRWGSQARCASRVSYPGQP